MAVYKCKMCGAALDISENLTVCECRYCGDTQTLPRLTDERKANLFDRANHFLHNNEYDKASGIYEQILSEDSTDPEIHWSLVLCRFGIEYVDDPATHSKIPTINRTQYTSIFDDADFISAISKADFSQREIYEQEAERINNIQKGILEISQKEEPYDVFICYKETDKNGKRTIDSVLANDIYHQLTQIGLKVFFSRISLEDKIGSAYEPYIFAALNTAKVMIVLGTTPDYFKAVWVKNEWSRYLGLIKKSNGKKVLIPAYRDMDPYDLPEEFSHLQAQDMGKLGFMQDLIRGIRKILEAPERTVSVKNTNGEDVSDKSKTASLLKRAFIFLEDGDFEAADKYCEKALDIDPECAEAYIGKLMIGLKVTRKEDLAKLPKTFSDNGFCIKAYRFGDEETKQFLDDANKAIIYKIAKKIMKAAETREEYIKAVALFSKISDWKDSKKLLNDCRKSVTEANDSILEHAIELQNKDTLTSLNAAVEEYRQILDWKNANELFKQAEKRIAEISTRAKKRKKRNIVIALAVVALAIGFSALWRNVIKPNRQYAEAVEMLENGDYFGAQELFFQLGYFKDSRDRYLEVFEITDQLRFEEKVRTKVMQITQQMESTGWDVGDIIKFGDYEWRILAKEDKRLLLITAKSVDRKPYNNSSVSVTWESCSIREWLNNDFYNSFNKVDRVLIETNKNNSFSETSTEGSVNDKVFLLSIDEAYHYLPNYELRKLNTEGIESDWWLRSSGGDKQKAAFVNNRGAISEAGKDVAGKSCVRPAIWINLNER